MAQCKELSKFWKKNENNCEFHKHLKFLKIYKCFISKEKF